ncbi:MAG: hypothetical protein RIS35_137 [Pseudomonadota bacterium]
MRGWSWCIAPGRFLTGSAGQAPRSLALFFLLLLALWPVWSGAQDGMQRIVEARLSASAGARVVSLPNILAPGDYAPDGSRVRYALRLHLERRPESPLGVYVPKMSLGGEIRLNGEWVGACAIGDFAEIRCLHQPQLFVPPPGLWREGANEIVFELFANAKQPNGLSAVTVGPAVALSQGPFERHYFLQVELLRGLAWAMACFGVVSLALSALFRGRDDAGFFWFGVTSLVNALCNLNVLVQSPSVSVEFFAWFVFSTRLVSIPLLVLTVLAFFGKATPLRARTLVGSVLVMPVAVWTSGNDPGVVGLLYLPFLLLCPSLFIAAVIWTRQSGRAREAIITAVIGVLVAAGIHDWAKFTGIAAFERTYLLSYANALTLLVMGAVIVGALADALRRARAFAAELQRKVAEKESELRRNYAERRALDQQNARLEERDRLLRDMHDGMGSSLSTARILLRAGRISVQDAAGVLQECIDDLRLMIDASGNPEGDLGAAFADFRFRIEQRLEPESVALGWDLALEGVPPMPTDELLQVMRIVQEAVSNALRHSGARRIEIAARWRLDTGVLEVSVGDDGRGLAERNAGRGRGLDNMQRRAAALRANLRIEDAAPGTRVRLELPLPSPVRSAVFSG